MSADYEPLVQAALKARGAAYAPYSKFRVGAALQTADGQIFTGCNVENASYGLTLCAECALVGATRAAGAEGLVAVSCVSPDTDEILQPCGRCRQILFELGTARDPFREPLRHDEAVVTVAENVARQRARDGYGLHHMCPTSSGMSKNVGWR